MKNLFVLLVILIFSVNESLGIQLSAQVSIGIKGSLTNSWMDYGKVQLPDGAQTDINGESFSILSYYKLSDHFSVGVEPGYAARGAACVPGWNPIFEGDTELRLRYVELPLLASYSKGLIKDKLFLAGKLGYNVAYLTKATTSTIGSEIAIGDIGSDLIAPAEYFFTPEDRTESLRNWDHGLQTGISLSYHFKSFAVFSDLSYYHGYVDVDELTSSKNRVANLSCGILFNFGKKASKA